MTPKVGYGLLTPMKLPPLGDDPRVSILVTCRDKERFIASTIESALAQDYSNLEVIVCNDGSMDSSGTIISELAGRDDRVHIVHTAGIGAGGATNAAFAISSGEVICLLDGDDLFEQDHVGDTVTLFRHQAAAGLCIGSARLIGPLGTEDFGRTPWLSKLPSGWLAHLVAGPEFGIPSILLTSTMSLRREAADRIFPVPPLRISQDSYIGAMAMLMTEVVSAPRSTVRYRIYEGQNGAISEGGSDIAARKIETFELLHRHIRIACQQHFPQAEGLIGPLESSFYYAEGMMVSEKLLGHTWKSFKWSRSASGTQVFLALPLPRRLFIRLYPFLPEGLLKSFTSPLGLVRRNASRQVRRKDERLSVGGRAYDVRTNLSSGSADPKPPRK